ncbi:caffeoylshikimate esterase-like [Nicotiana tabacum]|uniref:Caffeoylshikimate esterase-like n=2 Tax=Nicotiana TaxID=4085 RepID=A0A1S4AX07_TOBAC|nr:PREDICTED: caffeoylshikimate esterase-like isoform X1 [Nicotiana sylvestris]XP_016481219.1 PREDICTED: caffeoylshikimate esterase-like [Nicotiana tabacum]
MEENQNTDINQTQQLHYWGNTPEEEYYTLQNIKSTKSFFTSPRGLSLFTKSWLPKNISSPNYKGIIFMVHGYGNDISWIFQETPIFLAKNGFACFALDIEGHGLSQGIKSYVPNINLVVDDCISYFISILTKNSEFQNLPKFLFGESMGGAISLLIHFRNNIMLNGAILRAPMCKISEKMRPKWPIPQILTFFARFVPTLAIVPTTDLLDKSVKVPEKREIARMNPNGYNGKPRLGTVVELMHVTDFVSTKLYDVSIPFLVLHGSADVVTDPEVSKELYQKAKSKDKTIKIYDGMVHSLLFGETDENVEIVRNDMLAWLNDRS